MRVVRTSIAALAVVLALPAAAQAHAVTPSVDCSAATLVYESTTGTTLNYEIVVNGVSTVKDSFVVPSSPTSGTLTVPYTAPTGPFTVTVNATFSTGESGTVTQSMTCRTPPAPAPAAPPPPPPPAAAVAPAPPAPPANAVAGEQVTAPTASARLGARSACPTRVVRVTVVGRQMRTIAFSINGRHVRTVTVRAGQRSVRVSLPMRNRRASQVVTARVRFRNGAQPRNLTARASRCREVAVQPTFTG
jgi:hypothetical protein